MPKIKDLTGLAQGRLTVLELLGKIDGKISYKCQCSCGTTVIKTAGTLRGGTKSCGCLYTENARKALKIAAETRTTHGLTKTPTYICWRNMKSRCDDKNHPAYINYGERGLGYPEKWFKFEGFLEDMGMCPDGLTLNRIDVNLDYSKDNCEWVDNYKQGRDRRKPKGGSCKYKGVSFIVAENKYKATLVYQGIYYHLGYSNDPLELALRYDAKVLEVTGSMGGTNKDLGLLD